MGTVNANFLPSSTGFNLGSAAQRWDGFFQQVAVGFWNNVRVVDGNQFPTIQLAVDDITSTGIVFVPPGTYQELVTLKTGVWLIGSGWATILTAPDGLPDLLQGVVQIPSSNGASDVFVGNLQIDGNKTNQTAGRKVQGLYFFNPTRCKVSNLFVHDTEDHGIHFRDDGVTTRPGNEIVGNFVQAAGLSDASSVGGDGIVATACDHFFVSRNTVLSSLRSGIHLINGCTESEVLGNICRNNGQGTAGSGIRLTDSGTANTGIIVSTNRCFDDQGTKTQDYGLSIENASDKITLGVNDFTGNQTGDINNTASGAVTQSVTFNGISSFTVGDSSPSVAVGNTFRTANTNPTTILNFDDPTDGKFIFVHINDSNTTIADNANINLAAGSNKKFTSGDVLLLFSDGSVWREVPLVNSPSIAGTLDVTTRVNTPEVRYFTIPGNVTVTVSPGLPILNGSDGGDVVCSAGNGDNGTTGSNRNGGDVTMTPGSPDAGGTAGTVVLNGVAKVVGNVGFYNTTPIAKPTVTGSRAGNAALADLLTELANLGLITDSSS